MLINLMRKLLRFYIDKECDDDYDDDDDNDHGDVDDDDDDDDHVNMEDTSNIDEELFK